MLRFIRFFIILLVTVVVIALLKYFLKSNSNQHNAEIQKMEDNSEITPEEYVVKKLTEASFEENIAKKIFNCNELVFTSWFEYDRTRLDKQIGAFNILRSLPDIRQKLDSHPELATLVAALATKEPNSARRMLNSISNVQGDEYNILISLYSFYATPEEADFLSKILVRGNNKKFIIDLINQNNYDLSYLSFFELLEKTYEESPKAAVIYQKWLYSELEQMIRTNPETDGYDNYYLIIISQSEPIIESLKGNTTFCNDFLTKYWPQYEQLLNSIPHDENYESKLLNYISSNDIWKFLSAYPQNGFEMFKIYGELAPHILLNPAFNGNEPEKKAAQRALFKFAKTADPESRKSLYYIPDDAYPMFSKFLSRNIDSIYIQKGINALANAEAMSSGTTAKNELNYWDTLSDKTLLKEDAFSSEKFSFISLLPGYDIGVLVCKCFDGRRITKSDLIMAGIDTAFISIDTVALIAAAPTGGGSVIVTEGVKNGAKTGVKSSVRSGAAVVTREAAMKSGTITLEKTALKSAALKSVEKRTVLSGVKVGRKSLRMEYKAISNSLKNVGRFDVTNFYRRFFTNSSIKCSTFKKLTQQDARIFMRADRRVIFDFNKFLGKTGLIVAEDVAIGAAGYLALTSKPGQEALNAITSQIQKLSTSVSESDLWKSDLSSWWMANQYGNLDLDKQSNNDSSLDK